MALCVLTCVKLDLHRDGIMYIFLSVTATTALRLINTHQAAPHLLTLLQLLRAFEVLGCRNNVKPTLCRLQEGYNQLHLLLWVTFRNWYVSFHSSGIRNVQDPAKITSCDINYCDIQITVVKVSSCGGGRKLPPPHLKRKIKSKREKERKREGRWEGEARLF